MTPAVELPGSLICCGFDGIALPAQIAELLKRRELGGVILFARNYKDRKKLKELTESIRDLYPEALIAVDQEGGRVVRFTEDFPTFPGPEYYVKRNDRVGLYEATVTTAMHLHESGVNFNLLPVCDLAPDEAGHVLSGRAATSNPEPAAEIVARQVALLREQKILSCAKHFPGLGSAAGDPHAVVSKSERSRDEFRAQDYVPFRAAVEAGVDSVMVTHLLAEKLDPTNLATFSSTIVQEELRGYLAFDGVVVTDDLQMGAVTAGSDAVAATLAALRAGCDLMLFGRYEEMPDDFMEQLRRGIEADATLTARAQESAARIEKLKRNRSEVFARKPEDTQ